MKRTYGERIFNVFNIILMLLLCVITLYPYLNQLAISLNEGIDTMRGGITIFPRKFTLENYKAVFRNELVTNAAVVSVTRVILTVILSLAATFSAAYALTRKGLPHKKGITLFFMIPAYVGAGVIPVYFLYRYLRLINSYWLYILPGAFTFYNMVIVRSFLQELPYSIEESAQIDGAKELCILTRIVLPLSKPVLATIALWVAVAGWNDYTTTLMYITNRKLYTLQYVMMQIIKESELVQQIAVQSAMGNMNATSAQPTPDSVKSAVLMVTTLPIIMVYPFLQKYFIKGVTLGAVKE